MKAFVGIDVSKKWLDMALWVDGEIVEQLQLDYNRAEIEKAVQELGSIVGNRELIFGCEATGQYHKALVQQLHELGYRQKVINPRMTHHEKMARNISSGNDAVEAAIIAQHLAIRDDPYWSPEHEGNSELRDLVLRRDQLKKELNREKNRLDRFTTTGPAAKSLKRGIKFIEKELETIEEEIKKVIDEDGQMQEDMELLQTIPLLKPYI
ncbi:MAG: transposase [Candidatus Zixiibacteriota bacterium]